MRVENSGDLLQHRQERTVLIVDDEKFIADLCAHALKGYRTLHARDGVEALRFLEQEHVDILLTDFMMPRLNGLDLLKAVRERDPILPVVVMTGYSNQEVILQALRADADDFVCKPINLLHLKTILEKALEKKALKEELLHLRRMDRLKSEFLGLVSHKLKTPTTAISLYIQALAEEIGESVSTDFRQQLQAILEESKHLDYLIQDLLSYSQLILENPHRPEQVDPAQLARSVLEELSGAFENRHQTVRAELPESLPPIDLDRRQIGFALRALLENALKFTPEGGTIEVRGTPGEDMVRLSVKDSGPGIPAEELPRVLEKFYQIDPARTGQVRGFGLGLFYAREFVQKQGGRLWLQSSPGSGTLATIELRRSRKR